MADVVELDGDGESEDDIFDDRARDLRELKVAQLQTELAKFKLSTSGKKAELIKRLLDHGWSGGGTTAAEHGCVPSKLARQPGPATSTTSTTSTSDDDDEQPVSLLRPRLPQAQAASAAAAALPGTTTSSSDEDDDLPLSTFKRRLPVTRGTEEEEESEEESEEEEDGGLGEFPGGVTWAYNLEDMTDRRHNLGDMTDLPTLIDLGCRAG